MTPERTCVGCRARAHASALLRCVSAGGVLMVGRTAPGRGAWVHPAQACLDLAERRHAWARALRLDSAPATTAVRALVAGLKGPGSAV